ncbi:MAG: SPFH domain-containing protein, partial [Planctomycetota bacterium]|nr:SPFH domain-containing protein [Planctomycetota bacterium]
GVAARNLRHLENYLAPAASILTALALLSPALWLGGRMLWEDKSLQTLFAEMSPFITERALAIAFGAIAAAIACFFVGMYAAGLARERAWWPLRAGAGNLLATAFFLGLIAVGLAFSQRALLGDWPDKILAWLCWGWMALQAVEILINLVLDLYRPRVAGVEPRPAYDSRLSGLLAEPSGLFRTFAHTLDYQFGFRVSETWFFRFLEKAFAPLLGVWLTTFYLLTAFFYVRPGEAAIVERLGVPEGVARLPERDEEWDSMPPPLAPGLHLKWPWPFAAARIVPVERLQTIYTGFAYKDEKDYAEKIKTLGEKVVQWSAEHVEKEQKYIMPMAAEEETEARPTAQPARAAAEKTPDVLYISGVFVLEYRLGSRPGDIYRYVYNHADPRAAVAACFEREISAYLAGADFWSLMVDRRGDVRSHLSERVNAALRSARLGVEAVGVRIQNLHPPAGEVGKSFQEVLASRQERESLVLAAEAEAIRIRGLAPSEQNRLITEATAYRHRQAVVAEAEKDRFRSQVRAFAVAPSAYRMRAAYQALEEMLAKCNLVIHPPHIELRVDDSKSLTPAELEIQRTIVEQAEKEKKP